MSVHLDPVVSPIPHESHALTFLESEINPNIIAEFRLAYERAQVRKNAKMWRSLVVIGVVCLAVGWWVR